MKLEAAKCALDASLQRAADLLGDITPHVFARHYKSHPESMVEFVQDFPAGRQALEGQMVEQVLYCLMTWFECPGEIEMVLLSTLPHHIDTLKVAPEHFTALIDAVCDTITDTIPADQIEELAVWRELRGELLNAVSLAAG